jgi:hypothetical protein
MKKLIIILLLTSPFQTFSQNLSNNSLIGIWEVFDVEIDSKIYVNSNVNNIDLAKAFFKTTKFMFSKNGLVKLQTSEKAPYPFNNEIFNKVFYFYIDSNIISVGSRKKLSNILYIQASQQNDFLYFNFAGALLKVKRIENSAKLKIDQDLIKSSTSLLEKKVLLHENIKDDEINENIDEFIKTYNCSHITEKSSLKKCVSETIANFFNRKFNPEIASDLGLSGMLKNKIVFIINKEGNIVNIDAESINTELSNEIIRTVNLLPKFIPAKQNGINVNIKYSFPFIFQIQD